MLVLLQDQCSLEVLDLSEFQSAEHNPTVYAEIVGQGLFTPFVPEYAPSPIASVTSWRGCGRCRFPESGRHQLEQRATGMDRFDDR